MPTHTSFAALPSALTVCVHICWPSASSSASGKSWSCNEDIFAPLRTLNCQTESRAPACGRGIGKASKCTRRIQVQFCPTSASSQALFIPFCTWLLIEWQTERTNQGAGSWRKIQLRILKSRAFAQFIQDLCRSQQYPYWGILSVLATTKAGKLSLGVKRCRLQHWRTHQWAIYTRY